ncbi:MAG: GNAT family N-acetyltransferase [Acidobacteriota bacterium]|nr:GNAT family N-acetyltransferase [Acidobacteriota bacterium]
MRTSPYNVEAVTSEEGLRQLEAEWNALDVRAPEPNVFAGYDWFRIWNRYYTAAYSSPRTPHVLVLRRQGVVAGVAPLVRIGFSRLGVSVPRIEFCGHEWDYNNLVFGDDPCGQTEAVVQYLAQNANLWDLIQLRNLRAPSGAIEHLHSALTAAGLPHTIHFEAEGCPFLPLDTAWEGILARFSASTRHSLRLGQSRIARMQADGLRIRIVDEPHREPALLDRMIAVERQKRVGGRPAPLFVARYREVFAALFATLGPGGKVAVALMELDGRLLAWNLYFRCGHKLWGYLTAYDHEFSRLSPGTMLLPTIIDDGFARGFEELDFMTGEEAYKSRWTSSFRRTCCVRIQNPRPLARLKAAVYLALRPGPAAGEVWAPSQSQGVDGASVESVQAPSDGEASMHGSQH